MSINPRMPTFKIYAVRSHCELVHLNCWHTPVSHNLNTLLELPTFQLKQMDFILLVTKYIGQWEIHARMKSTEPALMNGIIALVLLIPNCTQNHVVTYIYSIVHIRWPAGHMLRSNHGVCFNWNALIAAAETTNKLWMPLCTEKQAHTSKYFNALML